MGQFPQDGENGQNVAFFIFFWSSTVWFFQLFWRDFVRYSLKMFFVLVLAHLEPKLVLFEVNDIGDDGDDDL